MTTVDVTAPPIRRLRLGENAYPEQLARIHGPPRTLYLRGSAEVEVLNRPAVAIVGARACSPYGAQVARMLGRELGGAGLLVVSGLARGVDGEAHRGCLEAGGTTIAVLGCGIDRDYPAVHAALAQRIAESGLVVSEYEAGLEPAPWRFPARNRIIAGLAAATVIVEARERSGALITADFALEEGRDVFAVPGEITGGLATGTNRLLRDGASPLTAPADVLDLFGMVRPASRVTSVGPQAALVLERLAAGAATADELSRRTALNPGVLAAALAELELAGLATEAEGRYRTVMPQG
jgi:DNA processing protein